MTKGTAGEIIGAGIWAASAVAVTGYTFEAFKGSYQQFPSPGGGLGGTPPPPAVQTADTGIGLPNLARNKNFPLAATGVGASPITPGTTGVQGIVNSILGFFGADTKTPPTRSRPPRQQDRALQAAVTAGNRKQVTALINTVANQQKARGWTGAQFKAWVDSRPWGQQAWSIMAGLQ